MYQPRFPSLSVGKIDTQQLNAEPAAGTDNWCWCVLRIVPCILTFIPLATSLVCLFSPELMAFQVKHVKVENKNKNKMETGFCT